MEIPEYVHWVTEEEGTVILNLSTGMFFSLEEVGALIWDKVCEGRSIAEVALAITSEYDVPFDTANEDVELFLLQLEQKGLIFRDKPA